MWSRAWAETAAANGGWHDLPPAVTEHYDSLEARDPAVRQQALIEAIAAQVAHAMQHAPAYAEMLADIDPRALTSADALAALPVTRKSELLARQAAVPPFGGLTACSEAPRYLFASPGPIYEPATARPNYWRFARTLFAAGVRRGDIIHNAFSYHLTPAGAMGDSGCHALGCSVIPAGVGNTEQQLTAMRHFRPNGYIGTPSFLKILLEKAAESGTDLSSLNKAVVSGEALPPASRAHFAAHGIAALQCYATADLGLIAYETIPDDGLIIDEEVYVEIVTPGSGDPVACGEVGEVVVTTFNPDYPLIRFATGDLSAFMDGTSRCGRTNRRLRGWLGRADQTAKVRGMFVHPTQIAAVQKQHKEILRARLVIEWVDERDRMTLKCETDSQAPSLATAIAATLRDHCKVRGEVALVAPGSLPKDGVVIEDARTYE